MSMSGCRQQFFAREYPEFPEPEYEGNLLGTTSCPCSNCAGIIPQYQYSGHQIQDQEHETGDMEAVQQEALPEEAPAGNDETSELLCLKVKQGIADMKQYIETLNNFRATESHAEEDRSDDGHANHYHRALSEIEALERTMNHWEENLNPGSTGDLDSESIPPVQGTMIEEATGAKTRHIVDQFLLDVACKIRECRLIWVWLFTLALTFIWDYRLIAEFLHDFCDNGITAISELLAFNQAIVNNIFIDPALFPLQKFVDPTPQTEWLEPLAVLIVMSLALVCCILMKKR